MEDAGLTFTENTYGTFQWNTPNDVPNAGYGDCAVEFKPYEWALDHYNWEGMDGQNGMQWIESRKALCAAVGVKVNPVDITEAVVSVTDAAYTGKALTPDVTVVFGAKTLNKDTDYTVEYVNNVDTGTAEVIIKGKDNYTGTTQKNFQIDYLKNAPDAEISGILGENDWYKSIVFLKAPNGYKIAKTLNESWDAYLVYPEEQNEEITYYLKKDISDEIAQKTRNLKIDMTAPVGTVELVDRGSWGDFINDLTFGLFFKDEVTVKINSTDTLSCVNKVQYFASDKAMNLDDVKAVDEWTDYNGSFGVTVEDAKRFIYYVCISDHAGNKTYLSTDGAEYDLTAPVISGIEDGETYYTAQPVTVTDENIDTITVNGSEVTGEIVLENNADAVYTVEVVDKAGNVTTVTITMKSVALVGKNIDDLTEKNVTSEDQDEIQEVIDEINELLKDEDMPEVEKKVLQEKKSEAENLIEKIEEAQKAISTKNIAKVKDITSKNVKKSDKKDLEHAKADLEKALKEYGSNYTDAQKKAIQKEIKRIEEALKVIGNMNQTANKTSPKTGDYNNLWVWFVMLMVSGAGVLGITQHLKEVYDEKKNKHI